MGGYRNWRLGTNPVPGEVVRNPRERKFEAWINVPARVNPPNKRTILENAGKFCGWEKAILTGKYGFTGTTPVTHPGIVL